MKREQFRLLLCLPLAAAVVVSAIWVIKTKHESRQLFVELESLNRERDRLQVDWGRLQLEESTWGPPARVETLATEQLSLRRPIPEQVVVVAEPLP